MIINPYRFGGGGFEDFGNASRAFDGTNDYLTATNSSRTAFNYIHDNKVFTIAAWVKFTDHTADKIQMIAANNRISTLSNGFNVWYDNRSGLRTKAFVLYITHGGGAGQFELLSVENQISDNLWHHVCWTGDGTTIKFYLDGVADGTTEAVTYTGTYGNSPDPLQVGRYTTSGYLGGKIADFRIYDEDIETTAAGSVANLSNGIDVATGLQHWNIKDEDSVEDYALGDNPAGFYNMTDFGTTYDNTDAPNL